MRFDAFMATLDDVSPPRTLPPELQALWLDAKGDWDAAHHTVQDTPGADSAWVHAYLHRKEGDLGNADYWYRRARRARPDTTLDAEWRTIVEALLDASSAS